MLYIKIYWISMWNIYPNLLSSVIILFSFCFCFPVILLQFEGKMVASSMNEWVGDSSIWTQILYVNGLTIDADWGSGRNAEYFLFYLFKSLVIRFGLLQFMIIIKSDILYYYCHYYYYFSFKLIIHERHHNLYLYFVFSWIYPIFIIYFSAKHIHSY